MISEERILLIGGLGFIGSNVCRKLLKLGHKVAILDSFVLYTSPFKAEIDHETSIRDRFEGIIDKVDIIRGDAKYGNVLEKVLAEIRPKRVIHFASMPISTLSNILIGEAIDSTVVSTSNILEVMKNKDFIERFVYISSSMVYGDFEKVPAPEDHPLNPKDIYGGAKLCGEILTKVYGKRFDIKYTIIRPSAVYGPTDINKRISQIIVENAVMGKTTEIRAGDKVKLDFTHVTDVAEGIVLALFSENAINETFNITSGNAYSLNEFVEMVRDHYPDLKIISKPADKRIPLRGTLDISKARRLLNFTQKYELKKGIREYIEYTKKKLEAKA